VAEHARAADSLIAFGPSLTADALPVRQPEVAGMPMTTRWKFFVFFFCVHLVASVTYYFLSGQPGSESLGPGGGRVGVPMFGGMMFLLSGGQPMAATPLLPLIFLLNSALTAGVATGIFLVVRRLRAA
jgi:hypothetical protein